MSAADSIVPLFATPWRGRGSPSAAGKPLPGLPLEAIEALAPSYPVALNADTRQLLSHASGVAGTVVGDLDFTARRYPDEPLAVLRPCLTLSVDQRGWRWIAEGAGVTGLPGPVWCIVGAPPVAVRISRDLATFLSHLRRREESRAVASWLWEIGHAAATVWDHRYDIAKRCRRTCQLDRATRYWLYGLPLGALVYDLQAWTEIRGWPYALAGERAQLFRCGRLPVFAVAD